MFHLQFTPQYGDSFLEKMRLLLLLDMRTILASSSTSETKTTMDYINVSISKLNNYNLGFNNQRNKNRFIDLRRECINADPNYGVLWFFSKLVPFDPAQQVLETAKGVLLLELQNPSVAAVYFLAMMKSKIGMPQTKNNHLFPKSIHKSDFVTGLIAANRVGMTKGALNIRQQLGDQGFLKLLFGADEIRA